MIKENIPVRLILPLVAASAVLRKEKLFRRLLYLSKEKRIPARKIYEILLQSYLFAGFPSALISLKIFKEIFPVTLKKNKTQSLSVLKKSGEKICGKIYGDKCDKLIANVNSFSPDLAEWLVVEGYGKVLSRNQLSLKEREMSIIAMLTVLKFEDQLYSHINGAARLGIPIKLITELVDLFVIFGHSSYSIFGIRIIKRFLKIKELS